MGTNSQPAQGHTKASRITFILIPLFFLGGRYFGYSIVHTMSAYLAKPEATFFWTLGVGAWLSVMYWLLQDERNEASAMAQAIRFGVVIFGIFWLVFNVPNRSASLPAESLDSGPKSGETPLEFMFWGH
jgi:hypothetical protein